MRRRRVVSHAAGSAGASAVLGALVFAIVREATVYVVQKKVAESHDRDPAGAVWYAQQLADGSHLALSTVPYRGALAAYLSSLSPAARAAWWDEALDLADDAKAFVVAQKRLSAARSAAEGAGPEPFRSSAAPGPTLLPMCIVWEAAANLAADAGQRQRARARWQAFADARHVDAMRWWNDGSITSPNLARRGPPPARPVVPRWTIEENR